MKGLITICQNKRVALPYIFGKYVFPEMQRRFNGELKLIHIFHDIHLPNERLASNKLDETRLDNVRTFMRDGRYANATVLTHREISSEWPCLPSVKYACDQTISKNMDFHLWMEDDAIVYDLYCGQWATNLGSHDVGLYMNTINKEMINCAYFLSTQEYDNRLLVMLEEFKKNMPIKNGQGKIIGDYSTMGSVIDHVFYRACRSPVYIGPGMAYRHHPYANGGHRKTGTDVKHWLQNTLPYIDNKDLDLLNLDFDD